MRSMPGGGGTKSDGRPSAQGGSHSSETQHSTGVVDHGSSESDHMKLAQRDERAGMRSLMETVPLAERVIRPANGSHAKLCGRSRVAKPNRRAGCRQ
jgi:hypothetical protein